jgi:hypothetical protein
VNSYTPQYMVEPSITRLAGLCLVPVVSVWSLWGSCGSMWDPVGSLSGPCGSRCSVKPARDVQATCLQVSPCRSLWALVRSMLGSCVVPVGSLWDPCGSVWVSVLSLWVPVWSLWVPVGSLSGPCCGPCEAPVGPCVVPVGSLWGLCGVPAGSL